MSTVIDIFATRNDLLDLLAAVESTRAVHCAEAAMLDKPAPAIFGSASEILVVSARYRATYCGQGCG